MKARVAAAGLAAVLLAGSTVFAQFRGARFPMATPASFDGAFQYCRTMYRGIQGGGGWSTDYPDADFELSTRLGELTKTPVSKVWRLVSARA
jgi:hypothetical protein